MPSEPNLAWIESAPNFRDIGGLPTADGRHVVRGRVFRSEAILTPTIADAIQLDSHAVKLVADLRGARERATAPNAWWQDRGVELMELDITADIRGNAHWEALLADPGEKGAANLMRLTYRALPQAAAGHLARLFQRIADGHVPLVVHCTAGKDRTGVVIALLLAALGVPRAAIYADYLESGARPNARVIAATREIMEHGLGGPIQEGALQALCGVRTDYLDESFDVVEAEYGSVEQYLRDATGLDAALHARLQAQLLH